MQNKEIPEKPKYLSILLAIILPSCESPESSFRVKKAPDRIYSHLDYIKKNYKEIKEISQDYKIDNDISDFKDDFTNYSESTAINKENYQGYYKIGNPYQIDGITYIPQKYNYLEETGEASWYGAKFHNKLTANGEIYNMHDITAAHRTMPMPSIAKVTNLENGKSIKVRINDRGPFAHDRIIDLSKRSAEMLDFKEKGVVNVRVKYLEEETEELLYNLGLK